MKTLKTLTLSACLFLAFSVAKAKTISNDEKTTNQIYSINTYIDAVSRGKLSGLDQVVDKTAKFSTLRGKNIISFDKNQMLAFVKENENLEQTCTVSTSMVSSNADVAVVKVDMHYDGFVRSNYVTLTNEAGSWKITNVYSVFKS